MRNWVFGLKQKALVFLIFQMVAFVACAEPVLNRSPENKEFANWVARQSGQTKPIDAKGSVFVGGVTPDPRDMSYLTGRLQKLGQSKDVSGTIPTKYDSRDYGLVSPIKDQNPYGTCWAHAAMACLETTLLKNESREYDLSENNLVVRHGFYYNTSLGKFNHGGNGWKASAYLLRWDGPLLETQDPYPSDNAGIVAAPAKYVQNIRIVAARGSDLDNDGVKSAVMKYGAVHASYYHDDSYLSKAAGYYCGSTITPNHAVTVIGWDDNYSKSNFATTPAGNGAFIVKNSWGTSFGENGYFYVSYYDKNFARSVNFCYPSAESTEEYDEVAQYDPYGNCAAMGYSGTSYCANLFTATAKSNLRAVGFWAEDYSMTYEIKVYVNCSGTSPTSGTLALTQTGMTDGQTVGFQTVALSSAVSVDAQSKYAIVICFKNIASGLAAMSYEYPRSGYSPSATANVGESFYSPNGSAWYDLTAYQANANFCIKGYLKTDAGSSCEAAAGVWTTDVDGVKNASDCQLAVILRANYSSCGWCQQAQSVFESSEFLTWARDNGVYLVTADSTHLPDGCTDTSAALNWFSTLYSSVSHSSSTIYFPTIAVARPDNFNQAVGYDVVRNDGSSTVGGVVYVGTAASLISGLSNYLGSSGDQPDAPTGLKASYAWNASASNYKVTLSWDNTWSSGTKFRIYRSSGIIADWDNPYADTTATSYTDASGLACGATMHYWVTAQPSGSMEGIAASVTATAPQAPGSSDDPVAIEGDDFTTGGTSSWYEQSEYTHDGTSAWRSGEIGNNQTNWLSTTVSGEGVLSFWWMASCEDYAYDRLELLVDGEVRDYLSGNYGWYRKVLEISGSGTHTIVWRYLKDGSRSDGLDAGFVDQVEWSAGAEVADLAFNDDAWEEGRYGIFMSKENDTVPCNLFQKGDAVKLAYSYANVGAGVAKAPFSNWIALIDVDEDNGWWTTAAGAYLDQEEDIESGEDATGTYMTTDWKSLSAGVYCAYMYLDDAADVLETETYNNYAYSAFAICDPVTLGTALDNNMMTFTTAGTGAWYGTKGYGSDGVDCAASPLTLGCTTNDLITTVSVSAQKIVSFNWKNISDYGNQLQFLVDGEVRGSLTGNSSGWQDCYVRIPAGSHTLTWRFARTNWNWGEYPDCGFVDQVSLIDVPTGPTCYGLFVGINNYQIGANTLSGCVTDAKSMKMVCADYGDWQNYNMTVVTDYDATLARFKSEIANLASVAKSGDTVLIYDSGHGGSYTDDDGNYTKDTFLCTTDGYYVDADFAKDISKFASGVKVVVMLDTCHSAGMFKSKSAKSLKLSAATTSNPSFFDNFVANVSTAIDGAVRIKGAAKTTISSSDIGWIAAADYDVYSEDMGGMGLFTGLMVVDSGILNGRADLNDDNVITFNEIYQHAVAMSDEFGCDQVAQAANVDVLESVTLANRHVSLNKATDSQLAFDTSNYCLDSILTWVGQSRDSGLCARSVVLPYCNEAYMGAEVLGPGTISFDWKVSSASGYDYLEFTIDDETYDMTSGEQPWTTLEFELSEGEHSIGWIYTRNCYGVSSVGNDCGYIRNVKWTGSPYEYEVVDNQAVITRAVGVGGDVVIPSTIDGYTVAVIGENAFAECRAMTSVEIPSSVTNIGAFAFYYCTSLEKVYIPSSVIDIGLSAFGYCASLTEISVDSANPYYSSVQGVLYDKSKLTLLCCPGGWTGPMTIPAGVENIATSAFEGCYYLTSVSIPSSLTTIHYGAFWGCESLFTVSIPSSVSYIATDAFSYCSSLTEISVDVANMHYASENGALYDKTKATLHSWPGGKLGALAMSASVTSIGDCACRGCDGLTSAIVPSSVKTIGTMAFYGCSNLDSLTISEGVTSIGTQAFNFCSGLKTVTIPSSVASISGWAFYYCYHLTNVTISAGVTSIGSSAFSSCWDLETVTIPSTVTSIGYWAFHSCPLKTVYVNVGDTTRVKTMLTDSGFDYTGVTFKELQDEEVLIAKPVAAALVPYTGANQTGVTSYDSRLTVDGTLSAADAGVSYFATFTLPASTAGAAYKWSDGTTDPVEIVWSIEPRNINDSSVTFAAIGNQLYTGSAVTPAVTMTFAGAIRTLGTDYTVSYSDNVGIGTGTATVSGKGNFTGTKNLTFGIVDHFDVPWKETDVVDQEDTMIVYAVVSNRQTKVGIDAPGSVLAAFAANGELRGMIAGENTTRGWRYQLSVGIASASETGFSFKIWDAATGETTDISETLDCNSEKVIGTLKVPHVFYIGYETCEVTIKEGWTWITPSVVLDDARIGTVLSGVTFAEDDVVKTSGKVATYCDGEWNPSSFKLSPGVAYVVHKSAGGTESVVFTGAPAEPSLSVKAGWNWIGSTSLSAAKISTVTHSAGFAEDDVVKAISKVSTYCDGEWQPSSFTFTPGLGYKTRLANAGTLTFGNGKSVKLAKDVRKINTVGVKAGSSRAVAPWTEDDVVPQEDTMIVYMKVSNDVDKVWFDAIGTTVAAFSSSGECRGVLAMDQETYDGRRVFQLSVGITSATEKGFTFKVWDAVSGSKYDLVGTLDCNSDKQIGKMKDPYIMQANVPLPTTTEISFSANGGVGGPSGTVTATKGKAMPAISGVPTKTGYTFGGYCDAAGVKYYNADLTSAKNWDKDDATATLYAQWTANTYTVTFHSNFGTDQTTTQTFTYDVEQKLKANGWNYAGHSFLGWAETSGGKEKYEDGEAVKNLSDVANGNVDLYAKWDVQMITVIIGGVAQEYEYGRQVTLTPSEDVVGVHGYTNLVCQGWSGGTGDIPATGKESEVNFTVTQASTLNWLYQTNYWFEVKTEGKGSVSADGSAVGAGSWKTFGATINLAASADVANHYHFAGWKDTETGASIWTADANQSFVLGKPVLITACFALDAFAVKFELGDYGTWSGGGKEEQTVEYGASATAPTVTAKEGCIFKGWDSDAWKNVTGELTVKAVYDFTQYAITYAKVQGDNSANPTKYAITNETITFVAPKDIPTGYHFQGWSPASIAKGSTGDKTVTAQWKFDFAVDGGAAAEVASGESVTRTAPGEGKWGETNIVCTGWIGTGDVPAKGDKNTVTFTITKPSTLTWLYVTNYMVRVNGGTLTDGTKTYELNGDWVLMGTKLAAKTEQNTTNNYVNLVYQGTYTGTGDVMSGTGMTVEFTVTKPSSVAWNYNTNYYFRVTKDGEGTITIDEKPLSKDGNGYWGAAGTSIEVTAKADTSKHYNFTGWKDAQTGAALGSEATKTFVLSKPTLVKAVFSVDTYKVTFDAGTHGAITSGEAVQSVNYGGKATEPTVTANPGYKFTRWDKTFDNITGDLTVTAQYETLTYKITYEETKGCNNANKTSFTVEDAVRFSALTNPPGWRFEGWKPDEIAKGTTNEVTVTAQWTHIKYVIDLDGVVGDEHYYGDSVTASTFAEKTVGYTNIVCTGWIGTGDVPASGVGTQVTFTVTQPSSLKWLYATNFWFQADVSGSGSIEVGSAGYAVDLAGCWVPAGTNVVLTAISAEHNHFTGWTDAEDGTLLADADETVLAFVMDTPALLEAGFEIDTFAVSFDLGVYGTRTGGGELQQTVAYGTAAIEPKFDVAVGHEFAGWDREFDKVVTNLSVKALYDDADFPITYTETKGCDNTANPQTYTIADAVAFAALTNPPGWKFLGWEPKAIEKGTTGGKTVTATWEHLTYEIDIAGVKDTSHHYGDSVTASHAVETIAGATNLVCLGWMGTGDVTGGVGTQVTFTVTQPSSLHWLFETNYWVSVAVDPGDAASSSREGGSVTLRDAAGGTLEPELWASVGTNLTVEATAAEGWKFAGWIEADTVDPVLTFEVRAPIQLTAQFAKKTYVNIIDGEEVPVTHGDAVTLSAPIVNVTNGIENIVCIGWEGTGDVPANGTGTKVSFTVTQPSTLNWLYETNILGIAFAETDISVDRGETLTLKVSGGSPVSESGVQVLLLEYSAKKSDLDLKKATVDGVTPRGGLKFPLSLAWEQGETSERVIEIPVKSGKATDAAKYLAFELAYATGLELGEDRLCTVTLEGGSEDESVYVRAIVLDPAGGKVSGGKSVKPNVKGEYAAVTLKATPNKGYWFAGWYDAAGERVSGETSFKVTPDGDEVLPTYEARFAKAPAWAVGTFNGRLDDGTGSATMTLSSAGKISGKVTTRGKTWSFSATGCEMIDENADSEVERLNISAVAKSGKYSAEIEISLTNAGAAGSISGDEVDGELTLWRDEWKDKGATDKLGEYVGLYTVQLSGDSVGCGYLSLTINAKGNCKATGKLPDGTSASATLPLVWNEGAPMAIWQAAPSAYKGGYVGGLLKWTPATNAVIRVSGEDIAWASFAPNASGEYGAGFERTLSASGAWYNKQATLADYYSTLAFGAETPLLDATVKTTDYDENEKKTTTSELTEIEAVEPSCWGSLSVSLNEKGTAFVVDQGKATKPVKVDGEWTYEGDNDTALTFSFAKATGIFKGSFTCWYDYTSATDNTKDPAKETQTHASKKVSYEGVMVLGESLRGFYLWDRTGTYEDENANKTKTFKYKESKSVVFE